MYKPICKPIYIYKYISVNINIRIHHDYKNEYETRFTIKYEKIHNRVK